MKVLVSLVLVILAFIFSDIMRFFVLCLLVVTTLTCSSISRYNNQVDAGLDSNDNTEQPYMKFRGNIYDGIEIINTTIDINYTKKVMWSLDYIKNNAPKGYRYFKIMKVNKIYIKQTKENWWGWVNVDKPYVINISSKCDLDNIPKTLLHELCHLILRLNKYKNIYNKSNEEQLCDEFAEKSFEY